MVTAARASLRALGLEQHQAVLVAHRDGTTPHVHVVANRASMSRAFPAMAGDFTLNANTPPPIRSG